MSAQASTEEDRNSMLTIKRYRLLLGALLCYLIWRRRTAGAIALPRAWGPRWLAALTGLGFSVLLRVVGRIPLATLKPPSKGVDEGQQYIVVWHPHGAYTTMAFMHTGYLSILSKPLTWFPGIASVLFNIPIFRETALLLNARAVTGRQAHCTALSTHLTQASFSQKLIPFHSVLERLLSAGLNIGIQPGGIPEQLQVSRGPTGHSLSTFGAHHTQNISELHAMALAQSDHRREIAVFPPNLGFIRLALRHGADLLPAYIFGENQAVTVQWPSYKPIFSDRFLAVATPVSV